MIIPQNLEDPYRVFGHDRILQEVFPQLWKKYRTFDKIIEEKYLYIDDPMEHAFISLKNAMFSTQVLVVPYFTKPFVMECDTSGTSLVEILTQEERPIDFTSK